MAIQPLIPAHTIKIFFLLCCATTELHAQQKTSIDGNNNTTVNITYYTNKKELARLEQQVEQLLINLAKTQEQLDSISRMLPLSQEEQKRRDDLYNSLKEAYTQQAQIIKEKEQYIDNLKQTLLLHKKANFLPFGIKQFKNGQHGAGWTFAISQVAVPVALGVGFECAARHQYHQHENRTAQTLKRHNDYYRKYEAYHKAAIYAPIASAAGIYLINVLCNRYCTRIEVKQESIPYGASDSDITGISVGVKF